MANGQTKLNYEDTDGIDLDLVVSRMHPSINVAVPPNRNDIKVHFAGFLS